MKRFMIIMLSAALLVLTGIVLFFSVGVYIPLDSGKIDALPFRTEGKALMRETEEGSYVPFTVRGVEVSSSMPGHFASEFYPGKEDYLRWFDQIGQMGANTIKAYRIMDSDFYDALYEYNEEHEAPLYLLQGIPLEDQANRGAGNAWDEEFMGALKHDGRALVDIIHGRKLMLLGSVGSSEGYFCDISRWVIGFIIGSDWDTDMVAYTNHSAAGEKCYEGSYFSTGEEASAFEAVLAQIMDKITAYETEKYGTQHPIGIICSSEYDFLEYEKNYQVQLKKYSCLDPEHIEAGSEMKAGCFAAYHMYEYCDDFSEYLSNSQKQRLGNLLDGLNRDSSYGGYLQLLSRYHRMPVLVSEYGVSSARGIVSEHHLPCTEEEQGQEILKVYQDAVSCGLAGVCISTWQDIWEQKSWNTSFATDLQRRNLWHDIQTEGQCFGLMAFEPGEERPVCTVDGDPGEWEEKDQVLAKDGLTLSARYDWKGLYLLLKGAGPEEMCCISLDLLPDVGSKRCDSPALTFSRDVDFLLCIDGTENSRLMVQERCQAMRENFLTEMTGQNPFAVFPDKDSAQFDTVQMAVKQETLVENYLALEPALRRELTGLESWDTGALVHGNGNPEAEDFCSQTDFCFGANCVEIRIPWTLLNVADPTKMMVHKDYYENYGVEYEKISKIWLGLPARGDAMAAFVVKGVGKKPVFHERLKRSYDVIQRVWEEEANASD